MTWLEDIRLAAEIVAAVLTAAAVIVGWLFTIGRRNRAESALRDKKIEKVEREAREAIEAADNRAKAAEEGLRRSLEAHKLHAAENYATQEGLLKALDPILRGIERLGDRFDRFLGDYSRPAE